ncbi:MAG: hypothetical protein MI755_23260 [Sphingomonadales bacterium]|nr:hypothetical protein [Sphingomonadales bacterium]
MTAAEDTIERTLTQADFDAFARLSGDDNPIHVDPDFSAQTRFGRTVSHGMLLFTILCGLADKLVPGARLASQSIMFPAPTFAGEPMRFSARITKRDGNRTSVEMASARVADGTVTCIIAADFVSDEGDPHEGR